RLLTASLVVAIRHGYAIGESILRERQACRAAVEGEVRPRNDVDVETAIAAVVEIRTVTARRMAEHGDLLLCPHAASIDLGGQRSGLLGGSASRNVVPDAHRRVLGIHALKERTGCAACVGHERSVDHGC